MVEYTIDNSLEWNKFKDNGKFVTAVFYPKDFNISEFSHFGMNTDDVDDSHLTI